MTIDYDRLFIGGEWVNPSSSDTIEVTSASTGEVIGRVPEAQEADVDAAVAAARTTFDDPQGWSQWEPGQLAERHADLDRHAARGRLPADRPALLRRTAQGRDVRRGASAPARRHDHGAP